MAAKSKPAQTDQTNSSTTTEGPLAKKQRISELSSPDLSTPTTPVLANSAATTSTNQQNEQPIVVVKEESQKVSKACDQCKERKIKCNGKKPVCGVCQRSNKTCQYSLMRKPGLKPGYGREFNERLEQLERNSSMVNDQIQNLSSNVSNSFGDINYLRAEFNSLNDYVKSLHNELLIQRQLNQPQLQNIDQRKPITRPPPSNVSLPLPLPIASPLTPHSSMAPIRLFPTSEQTNSPSMFNPQIATNDILPPLPTSIDMSNNKNSNSANMSNNRSFLQSIPPTSERSYNMKIESVEDIFKLVPDTKILLDTYFQYIHPCFPVLHRPHIEKRLYNPRKNMNPYDIYYNNSMYYAMLLVTLKYLPNIKLDFQSTQTLRQKCKERILMLCISVATIEQLQSMTLLAFDSYGYENNPETWSYISIISSGAVHLGLTKESNSAQHMHFLENKQLRRTSTSVSPTQAESSGNNNANTSTSPSSHLDETGGAATGGTVSSGKEPMNHSPLSNQVTPNNMNAKTSPGTATSSSKRKKSSLNARVPKLLRKPDNWTEEESRRRLFWGIYMLDVLSAVSNAFPLKIPSEEITCMLPVKHSLWYWTKADKLPNSPADGTSNLSQQNINVNNNNNNNNNNSQGSHLKSNSESIKSPDFLVDDENSEEIYDSFAYYIELLRILGEIHIFLRNPIDLFNQQEVLGFQKGFINLYSKLLKWKSTLPKRFIELLTRCTTWDDMTIMDINLAAIYHTTMIKLNSSVGYLYAQTEFLMPSNSAKERSISSVQYLITLVKRLEIIHNQSDDKSTLFEFYLSCLGPFFAFTFWVAARLLMVDCIIKETTFPKTLDFLVSIVTDLGKYWKFAAKYSDILNFLMGESLKVQRKSIYLPNGLTRMAGNPLSPNSASGTTAQQPTGQKEVQSPSDSDDEDDDDDDAHGDQANNDGHSDKQHRHDEPTRNSKIFADMRNTAYVLDFMFTKKIESMRGNSNSSADERRPSTTNSNYTANKPQFSQPYGTSGGLHTSKSGLFTYHVSGPESNSLFPSMTANQANNDPNKQSAQLSFNSPDYSQHSTNQNVNNTYPSPNAYKKGDYSQPLTNTGNDSSSVSGVTSVDSSMFPSAVSSNKPGKQQQQHNMLSVSQNQQSNRSQVESLDNIFQWFRFPVTLPNSARLNDPENYLQHSQVNVENLPSGVSVDTGPMTSGAAKHLMNIGGFGSTPGQSGSMTAASHALNKPTRNTSNNDLQMLRNFNMFETSQFPQGNNYNIASPATSLLGNDNEFTGLKMSASSTNLRSKNNNNYLSDVYLDESDPNRDWLDSFAT